MNYRSIRWKENRLELLDQRLIPLDEVYLDSSSYKACRQAIVDMVVRGAPLIGFVGIWAMAFWILENRYQKLDQRLDQMADDLKAARPTAVNLMYEVDQAAQLIKDFLSKSPTGENTVAELFSLLVEHVSKQAELLGQRNQKMAKYCLDFIKNNTDKNLDHEALELMTICNTGALACGPPGTALGAIEFIHQQGFLKRAWALETRPYLQGSRLTSFELKKAGIDHQILVEGASSHLLATEKIDAIIVGADRIAANGDTANKIGTSMLSILASYYKVPFIVMAPFSSFDLSIESGDSIDIEFRAKEEITHFKGRPIAPDNVKAWNPSFDVTRSQNISAIISEYGVVSPVNRDNMLALHG